jgi:hypothetical protein
MPPSNKHVGSGHSAKHDPKVRPAGHIASRLTVAAAHAKRPARVGHTRLSPTLRGSGTAAKGPSADRYENLSD